MKCFHSALIQPCMCAPRLMPSINKSLIFPDLYCHIFSLIYAVTYPPVLYLLVLSMHVFGNGKCSHRLDTWIIFLLNCLLIFWVNLRYMD
uniref:Uncharacterized protein n=1 Tax=Arundo donax TaxID=35708 RepID=A0A0A9LMJ5_ARUDO